MSAEDVRIVRKALSSPFRDGWRDADVALVRLEARLAEVERERDDAEQSWSMYAREAEDANSRAEAAEARLARLERANEAATRELARASDVRTSLIGIIGNAMLILQDALAATEEGAEG